MRARSICDILDKFFKNKTFESINYSGLTVEKRKAPVIISITSDSSGLKDLPKTVYSLLSQYVKPDRIILWLSNEYENLTNLPYELTQFIKNGLEIRFTDECGVYTNFLSAFREFSNSIIVTAKDNIYYKSDWLDKLYMSYAAHPEDIHVHNALRAELKDNAVICNAQKIVSEEEARFDNIPLGEGGILYPPNCFSSEAFRSDIFLKTTPQIDNLWFWVMALVKNRKIRVVKEHIRKFSHTNVRKTEYTNSEYDEQLSNLMRYYRQNIINKF